MNRWLSWEEVKAIILGGGGVAFTQADGREYERLVRELDGRDITTSTLRNRQIRLSCSFSKSE